MYMSKFMRVYKAILSLIVILTLLLVSVLCVNIYLQGDKPFTKETIAGAYCFLLLVYSFLFIPFGLFM